MSDVQNDPTQQDPERRRRIRRNVLLLTLVALGFYVAFIVLSISRS